MSAFPQAFIDSTRAVFGERAVEVLDALESGESVTAVRANPAKISPEQLRSRFGATTPVPWRTDAFYLEERPVFSLDPLLHAGAYYVQDPAAMFVGTVADALIAAENRPLKVLDLCAAPGGKSTCLASALKPSDLLVANEVIGSRAGILAENVVKWGSVNTIVTNNDPKDFARLAAIFDLILADVPCSGEGMFRKDAGAVAEWSLENVNLCAARQRRIIADAWDSLREGGWLIYSTCTFNSSENDDNVEWICRELGAEIVPPSAASNSFCHRVEKIPGLQKNSTLNAEGGTDGCPVATKYGLQFAPGITRGEGQYVALMRKTSSAKVGKLGKSAKPARSVKCDWVGGDMICCETQTSAGPIIKAYPVNLQADIRAIETSLRVIRSGVAAATVKGRDRIPTADLALSQAFNRNAFPQVELSKEQALQFLRCEAMQLLDAPKGFLTVTYEQLPIGFVKNLGSRANNLFPQAWRLRM
ncbi:MAG: rRNA cytosine-C5-methyltransferase [Bacteroidales bacterium]|nr:rRNA cytosine-C5-methyltransferase [Bacteroidales bacterium]